MFTEEVIALLKEVISSWQVIAVTIALVFYLNIVFYTAKSYHHPKAKSSGKVKIDKKKTEPEPVLPDNAGNTEAEPEPEAESESDTNADLGLEESE